MPGRDLAANGEAKSKICAQCQENEAVENVRGRQMCRPCFCRYIETKCVKRMEAFRTRHSSVGQERVLLLSLSLGLSSVSMMQLLETQLDRQRSKSGRTGFSLHVLHVDTSSVDPQASPDATDIFSRIKERYPAHTYTTIPISDVMELSDTDDLLKQNNVDSSSSADHVSTNESKLSALLSSLPSVTSRTDIIQILRTKLIVSFAKALPTEAILWGDTTTRLAEKTLSETAKGRGFGLAWAISDGPTPYGVDFYYPMRDLLKKELVSYSTVCPTPLTDFYVKEKAASAVVSAKNSSIDELMRGYFEGVEKNYPSIVANVVRTTGKLKAPELDAEDEVRCALCSLPVMEGGEDGFAIKGVERHGIQFCHGCARSFPLSSA